MIFNILQTFICQMFYFFTQIIRSSVNFNPNDCSCLKMFLKLKCRSKINTAICQYIERLKLAYTYSNLLCISSAA